MPRKEKTAAKITAVNKARRLSNPTRVAKAIESRVRDGKMALQARWEAEGNIYKGETKASMAKRRAKGDKAAKESLAKSKARRANPKK